MARKGRSNRHYYSSRPLRNISDRHLTEIMAGFRDELEGIAGQDTLTMEAKLLGQETHPGRPLSDTDGYQVGCQFAQKFRNLARGGAVFPNDAGDLGRLCLGEEEGWIDTIGEAPGNTYDYVTNTEEGGMLDDLWNMF